MDKEKSQKDMMYDQSEVNYTTLSSKRNQACANCRFFFPTGACLITEGDPLPILPTGYCDQWTAQPEPENDELEEFAETLRDLVATSSNASGMTKSKLSLKEWLLEFVGMKARDEPFETSGFKAIGNGKWVAYWSNNFQDKEGEYFPNHATDAYIRRLDNKEVDMPELWFWHVPYAFGRAKSVARIAANDRPNAPSIVVSVGEFYNDPIAKAFEKAITKSKTKYQMSHGFRFPPNLHQDGVYHYYDTFENSPLPAYAAANAITLFEGVQQMPIPLEKQREFEALLGKELTAEVVQKAEQRASKEAENGTGYKEMPIVDSEARAQLDTLTKEVQSLTEAIKAKMPMMDEEDDEDAKKKKSADEAYRKEVNDAIMTLAKSQTALVQSVKQITDNLELTPRRASKSADTLVPPNDAALKELQDAMAGNKSNEDKVFNAAFGSFLKGANNGA